MWDARARVYSGAAPVPPVALGMHGDAAVGPRGVDRVAGPGVGVAVAVRHCGGGGGKGGACWCFCGVSRVRVAFGVLHGSALVGPCEVGCVAASIERVAEAVPRPRRGRRCFLCVIQGCAVGPPRSYVLSGPYACWVGLEIASRRPLCKSSLSMLGRACGWLLSVLRMSWNRRSRADQVCHHWNGSSVAAEPRSGGVAWVALVASAGVLLLVPGD